jgi:hypothetical protein
MPRFWKCWCSSTSVSPWCLGSLLFVGPVRSSFSAVLTDHLDQIPRYLQAPHPRFIFLGHAYRSFLEFTYVKHNSSAAIKSGWPSGLRCQTQVLVLERGHQIKVAIHTTWYKIEFVQWQPRCYPMIQKLWTIHVRNIHRAHANLIDERKVTVHVEYKKVECFSFGGSYMAQKFDSDILYVTMLAMICKGFVSFPSSSISNEPRRASTTSTLSYKENNVFMATYNFLLIFLHCTSTSKKIRIRFL